MVTFLRRLALVVATFLLANTAYAQATASIAGVVHDASGAVLPGVTVEASSPALIEKVRSAVTDGSGQYKIEALRPGVYTVTFTLAGFATLRREGIELSGSFAATVNADFIPGLLYRGPGLSTATQPHQRTLGVSIPFGASVSYVPGGHAFKIGFYNVTALRTSWVGDNVAHLTYQIACSVDS